MSDDYSLSLELDALSQEEAYEIGLKVVHAIHDVLSGRRSGRWYPTPGNPFYDKLAPNKGRAENYWVKYQGAFSRSDIQGSAYQASAPGEPPAVRTGRLRQSFYVIVSPEQDFWRVKIKTSVKYADDLEFGTEDMAPRPFVNRAIRKAYPDIVAFRKKTIQRRILRGKVA